MRNGFRMMALAAGVAMPALALAQQDDRLVFLGADPAEGRPGLIDGPLSVLSLPVLPQQDAAQMQVLSALLRSNPVSTFVSTPDTSQAQTGALYLVLDIALSGSAQAPMVTIGEETMEMADFAARLAALADAFNPVARQIAFLRLDDPQDVLPSVLDGLRGATDGIGIGLSLLMVGPAAGACGGDRQALHYPIIGGLADRAPFGDDDRQTTVAEAARWASGALARDVARGAPCAARYSLILRGDDDPGRVVAMHGSAPLIRDMESVVFTETFEALFLLSSADPAPIRAYLDSCTYCPSETALTDRLRDIGERQMALELETGVWETIREDEVTTRLEVYLQNCQLCAYQDEAQARIDALRAAAAARAEETARFDALVAARDLPGLRAWVADCIACDQIAAATALIDEIEADGRVQAEAAALDAVIDRRNASGIADWLEACEICDGRARAEAALEDLAQEAAAAGPCLAAAGLPQQGGPRLLAEIDIATATAACGALQAGFPDSPIAATALGRIAQAAGDLDAARAGYLAGMEAGLPQAYGLAAHSAYAPGEGIAANYDRAAALAAEGLAMGDWLSGEVLTVLYSRELVAGKGPADAFAIAAEQAAQGNPVAQFFAGYFHRIGAGTDPSDAQAAAYFEQAVAQGYLHANSFLAEILEAGGDGVQADAARATDLYWDALLGGDPTARDRLTAQIEDRNAEVVREVQTRLREAGIFNGRIDGIAGPNTASAVTRFVEVQLASGPQAGQE